MRRVEGQRMKIRVTGAAGFRAKFVVERLQTGHELTRFDRVPLETAHRFIRGDITSYSDVLAACGGPDVVVRMVALGRGGEKCSVSVAHVLRQSESVVGNFVEKARDRARDKGKSASRGSQMVMNPLPR
jgi:hypothetical protein